MKFALQRLSCAVLFAVTATSANARSVDQSTAEATTCRVYMGNENSDTKKQCEAALAKYRQRLANEPDSASAAALTELQSGFQPVDYAAAIKLLIAAKARGAGWAAYWLAKLYSDGRGLPQSLTDAAENYQFALDHGYPSAVADYVSLFRDGRLTPVDKVRAKTILDAELGRNNLSARYEAEDLERLDALQRVYVIPKPDGKIALEQVFGPNLRPMEADKGFFDGIWKLHNESFENDKQIIADLSSRLDRLETPYFFELARRVAQTDTIEALKWMWLARIRMEYDVSRCANETGVLTYRWREFYEPSLRGAIHATQARQIKAFEAALAIDRTLRTDISPWWVCAYQDDQMYIDPRSENRAIRIRPKSEWPEIKNKTLDLVRAMADGTVM